MSYSITQLEKFIYNTHLRISRSSQNQPFTLRKDFSKLKDADVISLKKLSNFFTKFPHIDIPDYFAAPFKLYDDEKYFDLKFYATQKGIKAYTTYKKKEQIQSPDKQLEFIKASLKYIALFCIDAKIQLKDYIHYKPHSTYSWMIHVKNYNVSIYVLLGAFGDEIESIIAELQEDEKELFVEEISKNIISYKMRLHRAEVAKEAIQEGIKKIDKFIKKQ